MGQDLISRHSKVFKIYTKYLSCLANNQVANIFVCHLCPCLSSWPQKLRQTAAKPQRTWHVKECCCMSLLDHMTRSQGSQRFFIGKLLVCGVSLGLFPGPCIFTALLWRSSHFVLVVSACARAKQKPKGPGLGESFSFVHMDFVWAGHLFLSF